VENKVIQVKDKKFERFIPYTEIEKRVEKLAQQINEEHQASSPLFIGILNGAFMFSADLLKHIHLPCQLSFLKLSSYIKTESSDSVETLIGLDEDIKSRDIIILEDIVESGQTLSVLKDQLKKHQPNSIQVATLFYKPEATTYHILRPDYIGFEIPNDFIIGYGLDYDDEGRNLKDVYKLVQE
jgi:hypoxanthine phosphoribosyltransferase